MKTYSDMPDRPCQGRRLVPALARVIVLSAGLLMFSPLGAGLAAGGEETSVSNASSAVIGQKSVDDLYRRWQEVLAGRAKTILLDVREQWEFEAGHIEGSSHIALSNLAAVNRLIPDRGAEIWVFCRTQRRAALAVEQLKAFGYANLSLVTGGVLSGAGGVAGWTQKGYPLWPPQAAPPAPERNCAAFVRQGLVPGQGCAG